MRADGNAGDDRARRPDRHRGHRRRPPDLQRVDHGGADRRRRGLRGGQARQPLRHRAVGLGRRAGGARRPHRPQARRRSRAASSEAGFGFMFAPAHHGATRHVVPVRKELAVRTIFNFLGPLTNPAGATRQVIGVSDPAFLDTIAGALARLGAEKALVVSSAGRSGRDEHVGHTTVVEVDGTEIRSYALAPEDVGLRRGAFEDVAGGTPEHNAAVTRRIFAGEAGPARDLAAPQRRRRDLRRGPRGHARGGRARRRGGDRLRRAPPRRSTRSTALIATAGAVLNERAGTDRRARRARSSSAAARATPLARLEAALDQRPEGRPVRRGAGRARASR